MTRPLEEYHALEDGELNRLWYEENDPRARDAFRLRWWIGGDPIAGKDLFAEYHDLVYERCLERGVLLEDEIAEVFSRLVDLVVDEFPSEPIPKFEDFLAPFLDRAIDELLRDRPTPPKRSDDELRAAVEGSIAEGGDAGALVRAWIDGGPLEGDDARFDAAWELLRRVVRATWGEAAAARHPVCAVEKPPPSRLDPSVSLPHFEARQVMLWAADPGLLSERERDHIEWRRACRERCVGARRLLADLRRLFGREAPATPKVAAELSDRLNQIEPRIPSGEGWGGAAGTGGEPSPPRRTRAVVAVLVVLAAAAVLVALLR